MLNLHNAMPCVGLVMLAGCLTFVVAPEDLPFTDEKSNTSLNSPRVTVVIDAGHGGKDNGATGHGLVEKNLTLDIAVRLEKLLQSLGFPTVMTRTDDRFFSLPQRTAMANDVSDSIVLSLHFNHDRDSSSNGVETFYAKQKAAPEAEWAWVGFFAKPEAPSDNGEVLAGFVQSALARRMQVNNRGIKPSALYMVRHTRAPAALIESGFLSNPFEARLLANPEYRERIAFAIAEGVMAYQKSLPRAAGSPPLAKLSR
jgi:N-acetylmuramoyl-L-alanine amidase